MSQIRDAIPQREPRSTVTVPNQESPVIQPSVPTLGMPSKFEVINHLAALKAQSLFWTKILRAQEALEDKQTAEVLGEILEYVATAKD